MGGLRCGQALVWVENSGEGKGRPPSVYGLASVGGPVLPGGCVGLEPPFAPPNSSLLFPFPTVGLQAAVTSVGFLQPGPQLVQLRHCLPGPLSQSHLPGDEPAPHSSSRLPVGQPPPGCSPPGVFGWILGVLQVKRSLRSRPGRCCRFKCTWALCDTGRQALMGGGQALLAADPGLLPSRGIETSPLLL